MASVEFPVMLNARWRVTDDGIQWILEQKKGRTPTVKSAGWRGRSFHRQRASLLARIGQLCGAVDTDAFAALADLPERHP